ncbi:class I SAM-dependent methyltransferase [Actinoplanes sp. ATCC 53533]|uniref:class I SAM-dependent methyltransferase n=1 Tax=Actinoplanes sp. ATCC 53533 TaxID=1288362 RepID=UPI0021032202|nr:class I SAM-dependent methyltransferase [Actinoplanes sp. ATCC 53533]
MVLSASPTVNRTPLRGAVAAAYGDGVAYSPTPGHQCKKILRDLPISTPDTFLFLDLGSGKGRTLLLAAELGYRRVVGVEFDPGLASTARSNIEAYEATRPARAGVIEIVQADAAGYDFPPDPAVMFLFNPFGEDTLRAVINNLERSLQANPRPFYIAYYNPMHQDVLDACHLIRRIRTHARWTAYESVQPVECR